MNKEIAKIFLQIAELLEIKGDSVFRIQGYKNAAHILNNLKIDVADIYQEGGLKAVKGIAGIGERSAKRIEEYIKSAKRGQPQIKDFTKLQEETAIRQIITHFFQSKGLSLQELKENAKKRKIIYSRFTKPAKQLLELAGSIEKSKEAISKVASWAKSRKLDYTIETVFKKWLEIDTLTVKEKVKKPFYLGDPMIYSDAKKKWFVIKNGEWLMFAGKDKDIEWKEVK